MLALWVWLGIARAAAPLDTVDVDLTRYVGTWYEIARFETPFEKGCEGVTATYTVKDNGRVQVLNKCHKGAADGPEKTAIGVAKIPDPAHSGRLRVSFFRPFWGDYQVMALGDGTAWSVVGDPSRRYLWILSRTPTLPPDAWQAATGAATAQGFDVSQLRMTAQ